MTGFAAVDLLPAAHPSRALVAGAPELDCLLAHRPGCEKGLVAAARAAAAREIDRAGLSSLILARLRDLDAPVAALRSAARLAEPGVVVVVAGQQPGLLGGAWMVLVKALAAVAVARRLEELGIPAVPLFWHASEDDDLAEADHVGWPSTDGLVRLRAAFAASPTMLSHAALPPGFPELLERVRRELPAGAGRGTLLAALDDGAAMSFGDWTARLLVRILGPQGVVLVEPATLRSPALRVAEHEFTHPGELHAAVRRAEQVLAAAGFESPLALRRPELVFVVDAATGSRRRLRYVGGGEFDVAGGGRLAASELVARLHSEPAGVAWNVAARVLAQDLALPVAAQICGPAELAYVALLREAHALLDIPQPAAWLRPGVTLVPPRVRRACEALGVAPSDVARAGRAALPPPPEPFPQEFAALESAVAALPEGTSPAARRRRRAVARNVELLVAALRTEQTLRAETAHRRRGIVLDGIRPEGRPMERCASFLPWFSAVGDAGVSRLARTLGNGAPTHHVVRTEDL